jgi:hypothetical protein
MLTVDEIEAIRSANYCEQQSIRRLPEKRKASLTAFAALVARPTAQHDTAIDFDECTLLIVPAHEAVTTMISSIRA